MRKRGSLGGCLEGNVKEDNNIASIPAKPNPV